MNTLELTLKGVDLQLTQICHSILELKLEVAKKSKYDDLPEWLNIEMAAKLKGGFCIETMKNKPFLQPCCGANSRTIGGRKCWKKDDVVFWIGITDADLKSYAEKWGVKIPAIYEKRSGE